MPYDGDQFFSTAQRLASTCTHGSETQGGGAQGKRDAHKQDAAERQKTTIQTHEHHRAPQRNGQH